MHLDDISFEEGESPGTEWKPVRRFFGIASFGTNVARATVAGDSLTHDHGEVTANREELFLIISGHATYRVGAEPRRGLPQPDHRRERATAGERQGHR